MIYHTISPHNVRHIKHNTFANKVSLLANVTFFFYLKKVYICILKFYNMDSFPKFIIETDDEIGDCLIISKCTYHHQLAIDKTKVKGGGWWTLKENVFVLYEKSEQFGRASLEDIKNVSKVETYFQVLIQMIVLQMNTSSNIIQAQKL